MLTTNERNERVKLQRLQTSGAITRNQMKRLLELDKKARGEFA